MIIVSTELDEVLALADRIAVMYRGKIIGILPAGASRDEVGLMMAGVAAEQARTEAELHPSELAASTRRSRRQQANPRSPPMSTTVDKPLPPEEFLPRPEQRRPRTGRTWLVTVLAIVVALVIGALLMIFSDDKVRATLGYVFTSPGDFFTDSWAVVSDAYSAMFSGAIFDFGNNGSVAGIFGPISSTVSTAAPLICAGLGISLAFRSGLFNIGGQGQVIARRGRRGLRRLRAGTCRPGCT